MSKPICESSKIAPLLPRIEDMSCTEERHLLIKASRASFDKHTRFIGIQKVFRRSLRLGNCSYCTTTLSFPEPDASA